MQKKILFVSRYFLDSDKNNLSNKFLGQILALEKMGFAVYYIGIKNGYVGLYCKGSCIMNYSKLPSFNISIITPYLVYEKIYGAVLASLKNMDCYKYLYGRNFFTTINSTRLLRRLHKNGTRIIMEIPTYPPIAEYKSEKNRIRKLFLIASTILSKLTAKYVDLYALIGKKSKNYLGKPAININNGILIDEIPLRNPRLKNNEIHLLALASMSRYQGYDRLIEGLREYYNTNHKYKIFIHFIGPDVDGSIVKWQNMSETYGISDYCIFGGALYGQELDSIFDQSDIGVATLGLHRKNMRVSSVLKVREYISRGLPVLYCAEDQAIDENKPYFLKISENDDFVDMNQVVQFYERLPDSSSLIKEMRQYAVNNLTWQRQFEYIFDKFECAER